MSLKTFIIKNEERARIIITFATSLKKFIIMDIKNLDLVKENLNKKISPVICPMCRKNTGFTPYAHEFQQVSYDQKDRVLDVNSIQYVSTVLCRCDNCSFMASFDLAELVK